MIEMTYSRSSVQHFTLTKSDFFSSKNSLEVTLCPNSMSKSFSGRNTSQKQQVIGPSRSMIEFSIQQTHGICEKTFENENFTLLNRKCQVPFCHFRMRPMLRHHHNGLVAHFSEKPSFPAHSVANPAYDTHFGYPVTKSHFR